ncbi:ABC transporter permease subunit [Candidatus Poribacteria bacterium]
MIWTITKREIHDNLLSSRFALATILCLILIVLGAYVSIKDYEKRMDEYSVGIQEQKGPRAAYEPKIYRKPEVLGIFGQGLERRLGMIADYREYHSRGMIALAGEMGTFGSRQSTYLRTLASIDFNFVVRVVMGLLAIFLAYDAVSGEREAGVLKLSFANSIPRAHILMGKFLGGVFCLIIPLAMSSIVALLVMQLSDTVELGAAEWGRLGIILMLSMLYLAMFYAIGLFVSCITKRATTTLMVSMLIWILLVVIIPNVGPAMVKRFRHRTSRDEMMSQRAKLYADYHERYKKKFGLTTNFWDDSEETKRQKREHSLELASALSRLSQEHTRELDRETGAARWIARLSPASAFSFASSTFARTDIGTYKRFKENVKAIFNKTDSFERLSRQERVEQDKLLNDYEYSFRMPEALADSFRDATPDIILLLLFGAIFFMGAYASFIKYDVR